jgi:hypothetical protein
LNSKGLFELFVVRECQVRLIIQNADGRVGDFADQGSGFGRGLGHGAEVVLHAQPNARLFVLRVRGSAAPPRSFAHRGVVGVAGVPGSGVDTDPVSPEQVRGINGATELITAPRHSTASSALMAVV